MTDENKVEVPLEDDIDIDLEGDEPAEDTVVIPKDEYETLKRDAEAKAQLTARAKTAEEKAKALSQKQIINPKPEVDKEIKDKVDALYVAEQKRTFGYENGLSPEETDHIFKINPNPSKEILDDPFVKGGIQAIRSAKRAKDNTPSITGRSQKFELPKSKSDLTADQKQAEFEKFTSERFGKN